MVSLYEAHKKIYPRSVSGIFSRWRWILVLLTQLVFYGVPWLEWGQRQAVLFDLEARRFYIFNLVLYPQDFIYLTGILVISALSLFLFTAVAGRLWCGYACPQTVYTEIFLWIEKAFEGDRSARMRRDAQPWSLDKLWRKGGTQVVWIALALWTGFTFVGYFTPIKVLALQVMQFDLGPWEWFWVVFYGLATYGNAGYLREQICMQMCPYARIQSALTDMNTMVIAYDTQRGEARGSRARSADPTALGLGNCIDCTLCVQVCPTGIDIRDGLQNECIACAACIDACDQVMVKMNYPRGLIRYSSATGMQERLSARQMILQVWRPRVWMYGALMLLVASLLIVGLSARKGVAVDVIKDRGALAREQGNGDIENIYLLKVMNAAEHARTYRVSVQGLPGMTLVTPAALDVPATGIGSLTVRLALGAQAAQAYRGQAIPITFKVQRADTDREVAIEEKSTFVIPR